MNAKTLIQKSCHAHHRVSMTTLNSKNVLRTTMFASRNRISNKAYFFAKYSFTLSEGMISSLNVYAPVFSERKVLITFAKSLPVDVLRVATTFFAIFYTPLILLFYFLMYSHSLQYRIVFLQFQSLRSVLL